MLISWNFQYISCSLFASSLHLECEIFKDSVVTILIGISESGFGYWIASQTKMILLGTMRFKSNN